MQQRMVTAWISDYDRKYFAVSGMLRKSKSGSYCIDMGNDGNYVFPLAHRQIEVYADGNSILKYSGMNQMPTI